MFVYTAAQAQDASESEEEAVAIAIVKTKHFTTMDGYYQDDPQDLSSSTFIGMGIGFAATGLFFIYAATNIILDENSRLAKA